MKLQVRIKRRKGIDLPEIPRYQTTGAACFDLASNEEVTVNGRNFAIVPTDLVIEVPVNHMMMIVPRLSLKLKTGLTVITGIIDSDYCGDDDFIGVQVWNPEAAPVTLERGQRIAQGVFIPITRADFAEVTKMNNPVRGGFGLTGV